MKALKYSTEKVGAMYATVEQIRDEEAPSDKNWIAGIRSTEPNRQSPVVFGASAVDAALLLARDLRKIADLLEAGAKTVAARSR